MDALIAVIGLIWAVYSIVEKQKKKKAKAAAWPTEEAGAKAEPAAAGAEPKQKGEWQRMLGELAEALEEDDEDEEDEDEEEKKAPAARAGKHKPAQRAAAKARKAIMGAAAGDMYISEAGSSLMDTANRYASATRRKSPVRNSPSISTHPAMSAGGAFWRTPRTHRGT